MTTQYRGVLFDLFGTLIVMDTGRLPELVVGEARVRTTAGGLKAELARWVPGTSPETFLAALAAVSEEMVRARGSTQLELPSRERFSRVLRRVGCDGGVVAEASIHLSRAHMALLRAATVLPPAHANLLRATTRHCRVGLVSNFDDTGTAYEILHQHGILRFFDTVVVSEALGVRKPNPAPVRAAVTSLGLDPAEVLLIGDTFTEDVLAAEAAGVAAAWIDVRGEGPPPGGPVPRHVVRALPEMASVLLS